MKRVVQLVSVVSFIMFAVSTVSAQGHDGCCPGASPKVDKAAPMSFTLPFKGASEALEKIAAVDQATVKDGVATLTLKRGKVLRLSEVAGVDHDALHLNGRLRLSVSGMRCEGCATKLPATLKLDGLTSLEVRNVKAGIVLATLKEVSYIALAGAVKKLGLSLDDVSWFSCGGPCTENKPCDKSCDSGACDGSCGTSCDGNCAGEECHGKCDGACHDGCSGAKCGGECKGSCDDGCSGRACDGKCGEGCGGSCDKEKSSCGGACQGGH